MKTTNNRGNNWSPKGKVQIAPVPFKLLRAIADRNSPEQEYVSAGDENGAPTKTPFYGDYAGQPFDPWRKGDLLCVQIVSSYHTAGKGRTEYSTWIIWRRDSTPGMKTVWFDFGAGPKREERSMMRYRIPYRYQGAAAKLVGFAFDSRAGIEAALEEGSQSYAIAAE